VYVGSDVTYIHEPWKAVVIAKNTNSKAACVFQQSSRQDTDRKEDEDEMKGEKKKTLDEIERQTGRKSNLGGQCR